jgi:hypothetical protein
MEFPPKLFLKGGVDDQLLNGKHTLRRIVIGSEETCKLHLHKGIVRANKREVNDYKGMVNCLSTREDGYKPAENVYNKD